MLFRSEFITQADLDRRSLVIVLGAEAAKELFPDGGAVGQTLRLNAGPLNLNMRVAGVMAPRGGSGEHRPQRRRGAVRRWLPVSRIVGHESSAKTAR